MIAASLAALLAIGTVWQAAAWADRAALRAADGRADADAAALAAVGAERVARDLRPLLDMLNSPPGTPPERADLLRIDAMGHVVAGAAPTIGRRVAPALLAELRAASAEEAVIGPLARGDLAGGWTLTIGRRLETPGGAFAGALVAAGVRADGLVEDLVETASEDHAVAALAEADGAVRVLVAGTEARPGDLIADSALAREASHGAREWTGASPFDGAVRHFAIRPVPSTGLLVVIGTDARAVAGAGIWRAGLHGFAVAALSLLGLLWLSILLLLQGHAARRRERGRRRAAEQAARAAEIRAGLSAARLEALLAGISQGAAILDGERRLIAWNERFPKRPGETLRSGGRLGRPGPGVRVLAISEGGFLAVSAGAAAVPGGFGPALHGAFEAMLDALGRLERAVLDPAGRRVLDQAVRTGETVRGLFNDLQLLVHGGASLVPRPAEIDLLPLLADMVDMFRGPAARRDVLLGLEIGGQIPERVVTDPARLRHVLTSLLGIVAAGAAPGPALLTARVLGRELHLALRDSGPPMSAHDPEPALWEGLVAQLGGRSGRSASGSGREFWLILPLVVTEQRPAAPHPVTAGENSR